MDFSVFSNPKLKNGKGYGLVVSALSKSIRRGRVEEALWCANALFDTFVTEPTDPSHRKTFVNYRTRFRNRLVVALLEDHTPSAPWLVALAHRAYVALRDQGSEEETRIFVCRAVQEACLAPTSRLLQHIRNCGDSSAETQNHGAVRVVTSLENAGSRVLKERVASFFSSRIEGVRELCADFVAAGNRDRARFVVQACSLMDYAIGRFDGVFLGSPNPPAPLQTPAEPPWIDRPEFFDMHVSPADMPRHLSRIREMRTNRGFVEREEGACRAPERAHAKLGAHPLAVALVPVYDAWRFDRDGRKKFVKS